MKSDRQAGKQKKRKNVGKIHISFSLSLSLSLSVSFVLYSTLSLSLSISLSISLSLFVYFCLILSLFFTFLFLTEVQEDVTIITEAVYSYAEHVQDELSYGVRAARDGTLLHHHKSFFLCSHIYFIDFM